MKKIRARCGSWQSPFQIEQMLQSSVGLSEPRYAGAQLFWLESRPNEKGRSVVMRRAADGSVSEMTPAGFSARTTVHEYGGGSYLIDGETVIFSNFDGASQTHDQRLYLVPAGGTPQALTPAAGLMRFADGIIDRHHNRVICVAEQHTESGRSSEVTNFLAAVSLDGSASIERLRVGRDFFSSPRLSPDGRMLAWVEWNHPNMPWDDTTLMVGHLDGQGYVVHTEKIAGGQEESVMEPEWSADGKTLYFISDRSNWWNLYAVDMTAGVPGKVTNLRPMDAEFGGPAWVFAHPSYAVLEDGRVVATYSAQGLGKMTVITPDLNDGRHGHVDIATPYTDISCITAHGNTVAFIGGCASSPGALAELNLDTRVTSVIKRGSDQAIDPKYVSMPRAIAVPTTGGATTYALFYAPKNARFRACPNERPPLVVMIHGGPTAAASSSFKFLTQYFTSRGFAVADVNYRGSTGYGRRYRNALRLNWGVVDWQDCEAVAAYLAKTRRVDGKRMAIRGGSAGGYTTLAALAWGSKFKAGASHYGVGDLNALAGDTHKFESRYLDGLVGPYPASKALYDARSPINYPDNFDCPVIFFQGLDDKIVPPNQAEMMVAALEKKGLPVAYIAFSGEQHGFRQAANIKRAIQAEFYFYAKIFGFHPADEIEAVKIANFKQAAS